MTSRYNRWSTKRRYRIWFSYSLWHCAVCSELVSKEGDSYFWQFVEEWLKIEKPAGLSDRDCIELIVKKGTALLGSTLSPLFHFALLLRSVSPKIVLYRQLSQESLSSHLSKDPLNKASNNSSSETLGNVATGPESDAWSSSENPKLHHGKCCWVDVGSEIFFEESELNNWLQSTGERWVPKRLTRFWGEKFSTQSEYYIYVLEYAGGESMGITK
jgi:hypothetical protein